MVSVTIEPDVADLLGTLIIPAPQQRRDGAVVVLGGSQGGLDEQSATAFAEAGFTALALAYFGVEPLPPALLEVTNRVRPASDRLAAGTARGQRSSRGVGRMLKGRRADAGGRGKLPRVRERRRRLQRQSRRLVGTARRPPGMARGTKVLVELCRQAVALPAPRQAPGARPAAPDRLHARRKGGIPPRLRAGVGRRAGTSASDDPAGTGSQRCSATGRRVAAGVWAPRGRARRVAGGYRV